MFNKSKIQNLENQLKEMSLQISYYQKLYKDEEEYYDTLKKNIDELKNKLDNISNELSIKTLELKSIKSDIKKYQSILTGLSKKIELQDMGLYNPQYKYATLQEYEIALSDNRVEQKNIIKNYKSLYSHIKLSLDGGNGKAVLDNYCKLIIENFNLQCERLINKVNAKNLTSIKQRLVDLFEKSNKKGEVFAIKLPNKLLDLKINELNLVFEKAHKYEMMKEERAYQTAILKEQERSEKHLEKERKVLSKNKLDIESKLKKNYNEDLNTEYNNVINKIEQCNKMLSNNKAGWVYIINNPAFGKDVYKIGVTRRPDPQVRIDELNSASVPFKFSINCILYSDDAFNLEYQLHREFDKYRVNKINLHKEYFYIPLENIEMVIKEKYDPNAEFIYDNIDENFLLSGYEI